MAYLVLMVCFGLAAAIIGKIKGSSFFIWFLIGFVVPIFGMLAAIFYRYERYEQRRRCEECGAVLAITTQVCTRCGADLPFPTERLIPRGGARA
jgi:ribosomal protein L40E